ncbi:hypothetical protein KIN20_025383 [Parelaphostrongylus tenuis]|uniref:Uncharacterized protein n=1 Tax=Parelaphostrongylus tenuis TaxID=148309 RepID=A0AAD5QWX3_PARTN|nr:hypothetical protein KIN20_025383 [Parelaphostrongylus tenuis]
MRIKRQETQGYCRRQFRGEDTVDGNSEEMSEYGNKWKYCRSSWQTAGVVDVGLFVSPSVLRPSYLSVRPSVRQCLWTTTILKYRRMVLECEQDDQGRYGDRSMIGMREAQTRKEFRAPQGADDTSRRRDARHQPPVRLRPSVVRPHTAAARRRRS